MYAVVTALSELHDADPMNVEPLNSVIDPEAMEALFGADGVRPKSVERLEFAYGDYRIVVGADGRGAIFGPERG